MTTSIILTETFTTPGDVTLTPPSWATGLIAEGFGGGAGASVWVSPISPKSGGGGGYAKTTLNTLPGGTIPAHVGSGGAGSNDTSHASGTDTWVGSSNPSSPSCIIVAGAGLNNPGVASSSHGDVKHEGGIGTLNSADFGPGVGGGGAGGPNGIGAGTPAGPTGVGGTGDGGLTAGGAHGATHDITDGQDATGVGGGGGGGSAAAIDNGLGGDGGYPGGGAGIGTDKVLGGVGGNGANGMLVIHWLGTIAHRLRASQLPRLIAYRTGIPAQQRQSAWTFILDGHRFYVLPLGPEGDWAYDTTTREWCKLQTMGFPGLNFNHGVMWGLRIIGGDVLYTYLYELDPNQPFDEAWREVEHRVTGGLATRTRSVIGVANFTLTASVGDDSATNRALSLAFSDDNGVTWSKEFDMMLTDVSTQMLIWNALGSFAAPGRVFRITDYSGPIRLDGADAVLTVGTGADSGQDTNG